MWVPSSSMLEFARAYKAKMAESGIGTCDVADDIEARAGLRPKFTLAEYLEELGRADEREAAKLASFMLQVIGDDCHEMIRGQLRVLANRYMVAPMALYRFVGEKASQALGDTFVEEARDEIRKRGAGLRESVEGGRSSTLLEITRDRSSKTDPGKPGEVRENRGNDRGSVVVGRSDP